MNANRVFMYCNDRISVTDEAINVVCQAQQSQGDPEYEPGVEYVLLFCSRFYPEYEVNRPEQKRADISKFSFFGSGESFAFNYELLVLNIFSRHSGPVNFPLFIKRCSHINADESEEQVCDPGAEERREDAGMAQFDRHLEQDEIYGADEYAYTDAHESP